jgi:hypothetical protein
MNYSTPLRAFAMLLLLAFCCTACVKNATIRFQDGKICEVPAEGNETCTELGPGQMAIYSLDDSGKVQLQTVPSTLQGQLAWLQKTGRVYAFEPGHLGGSRNGSVLRIFETGAVATDTVTDIKLPLKSFAWVGFMQESASAPVMMMMAGDNPCDNLINIHEKLAEQDTFRLTRHGSCAAASGGIGVIVIESNIIDPSNRINLLSSTPAIGKWIQTAYPKLEKPTIVQQNWLFPFADAPLSKPKFARPIDAPSPSDFPADCGIMEMIAREIAAINWGDPICTFADGAYQIRYCGGTNTVSFQDTDGQLVEMDLGTGCGMQFVKRDGMVAVHLQEGCPTTLNLNCLPNK